MSGAARGLRLALFTDTYGPEINGVVRSLRRLVEWIRAEGGAVRVFAPGGAEIPWEEDVVRWPCISYWRYPEVRLAPPLRRAALTEIRAWRANLVHCATPFGVGLAGRGAAESARLPLVSSFHTLFDVYAGHYGMAPFAGMAWHFFRWFHNAGLRTFAPTDAIARRLRDRGFERVGVWSRGIDAHRFSPGFRCDAVRAELNDGHDRPIVLYVGRLAAEKGLETGMRAAARVLAAQPGAFTLAVVGDGPMEAECRALAPAGTRFLGRVEGERLAQLYASADVFLFPSSTETFGNVQLEALASGLPVVAADCEVNREVLGPAGTFVEPGSPGALAEGLRALLGTREAREWKSAAGRRLALVRSWDSVFHRLLAEYLELADRGGRGRAAA
jgi:phosphatidylinositol alpha 1,6-mannosyltransferase